MNSRRTDLKFSAQTLTQESFAGQSPNSFVAIGCSFVRCDFSRMRPRKMIFASGAVPTTYADCCFDEMSLSQSLVGPARFERCSFERVNIRGLSCDAAEFVECTFSGKLQRAYFNGTPSEEWRGVLHRAKNQFVHNDFSRAALTDVEFRTGIDLTAQKLPSDERLYIYGARPREALQRLRERFLTSKDLEARRQVFSVIGIYEQLVAAGQEQLFICKDSLTMFKPEVVVALCEEMRA